MAAPLIIIMGSKKAHTKVAKSPYRAKMAKIMPKTRIKLPVKLRVVTPVRIYHLNH